MKAKENKYLIAIDSDGTLRHNDGTISVETKNVIRRLMNQGHIIVICTARPRYYTKKITKEVGASPFLISSNGSEIYDLDKKKTIFASYVPSDDCKKLYIYAQENDLRVVFVTENIEYVTKFVRNKNQKLLNDKNIEQLSTNKVKQIMIIGTEKVKINTLRKKVEEQFDLKILDSSNKKEEIWFSIGSNSTSKGIAVIKLAEILNIPLENTIAIGNDYNDVSMFEMCNISVAVDNADEKIKQSVKIITKSNNDDGVAEFLETLC